MINRTQFCNYLIKQFAESEGIKVEEVTEDMIFKSSSLAVALEYLGKIQNPENREYAASRGGIFILCDDKAPAILSVREMLAILPTHSEE